MGMEDLINECGGFGKYQVLVIIGIYSNKLAIGWSMLQMSFAGFIPEWHCITEADTDDASYYANNTLEKCSVNNSYTGYHQLECTSFRFEGYSRTAVTEWDLVCDRKWVKATITSIQMAGVLVGAVTSGQFADVWGRKKTTYSYSVFHALMNFGAAVSTSWEMFAAFRFFLGIGVGGLLVVTFPYPMEFLPLKWRPLLAVLPVWTTGVCLFSLAALFLDDWSYLHVACGVINIPAVLGYFYIPESVRWLTLKGRYAEAEKIFEKMAIVNGKIPPKQTRFVLEGVYKEEQECRSQGGKYTYWDLFKGKQQLITTLVFSYLWFSLSTVYYGISFGVSALSGNLYLNIFLLAIVELPPQFSTFCLNNIFGRKWTCIGLLILGVVPACGCWIVYFAVDADSQGGLITGLSLTSKMGLGAAFSVVCTWTSESYPTVVRSLGYGVVNTAARVGGIIAPFVIDLDNAPLVAYALITSMIIVAIIMSLLVPDTKGTLLLDSINKSPTNTTNDSNNENKTRVEESDAENDGMRMSVVCDIDPKTEKPIEANKNYGRKFTNEGMAKQNNAKEKADTVNEINETINSNASTQSDECNTSNFQGCETGVAEHNISHQPNLGVEMNEKKTIKSKNMNRSNVTNGVNEAMECKGAHEAASVSTCL